MFGIDGVKNWRTAKLSPDEYVGGSSSGWHVLVQSQPVSQHRTRAEAEAHFRHLFPGKPLYVWLGAEGRWEGGQPPGTHSWDEIDRAKARDTSLSAAFGAVFGSANRERR